MKDENPEAAPTASTTQLNREQNESVGIDEVSEI